LSREFSPERVEKARDAVDNRPILRDWRPGLYEVDLIPMMGLLLALCLIPDGESPSRGGHGPSFLVASISPDPMTGRDGSPPREPERDSPGNPTIDEVEPEVDSELPQSTWLIPLPPDPSRTGIRHHHPISLLPPPSSPIIALRLRC